MVLSHVDSSFALAAVIQYYTVMSNLILTVTVTLSYKISNSAAMSIL